MWVGGDELADVEHELLLQHGADRVVVEALTEHDVLDLGRGERLVDDLLVMSKHADRYQLAAHQDGCDGGRQAVNYFAQEARAETYHCPVGIKGDSESQLHTQYEGLNVANQ